MFDFSRWQPAAILDFRNFKFLTVGRQEGRNASLCQILSKSVDRGRDMAIFQFFKMAAAAILDFENFKFLTVRAVKRVELHHHANFRQNRSNCG